MPNTTQSQFMLLPVPVPTVDPGPQFSTDINSCLTLIDQHNHSSGQGVPVNPNGININSDLPFNDSYNATRLRSARFKAQNSPISLGSDIGCVYVSAVDLYYNDINGNQVRLTASGAVAGTPGSIGNLVSPATVTYNSGTSTYVFQATTATAGNIDGASITIRKNTSNSPGITLSAPSSLTIGYTLSLPISLPSSGNSAKFLQVDQSGNITDAVDVDNSTLQISSNLIGIKANSVGVNQLKVFNFAASSSSGDSSITSSTSLINVPNLQATITTTGRPIRIELQYDKLGINFPIIGVSNTAGAVGELQLLRNESIVTKYAYESNSAINLPGGFTSYTDCNPVPPSSSYTYIMQYGVTGGATAMNCRNVIMIVYEI